MPDSVIIVAGGKGSRFGGETPKQFLLLAGKPVLMRTIEVFHQYNATLEILVVLPQTQIVYWETLCQEHQFKIPHRIVPGGSERFHSVRNAIQVMSSGGMVAIHDAVRPLVSRETLQRVFSCCERSGSAVPVISVDDSLRRIADGSTRPVNRNLYYLVQTPQCFVKTDAVRIYRDEYKEIYTDDASVFEDHGYTLSIVEGNKENIKITGPVDLAVVSALWMMRQEKP